MRTWLLAAALVALPFSALAGPCGSSSYADAYTVPDWPALGKTDNWPDRFISRGGQGQGAEVGHLTFLPFGVNDSPFVQGGCTNCGAASIQFDPHKGSAVSQKVVTPSGRVNQTCKGGSYCEFYE